MKWPKTITIDTKQFRAAVQANLKIVGSANLPYTKGLRDGVNNGEWIVNRLGNGWQFIDGVWIEPPKKPNQ